MAVVVFHAGGIVPCEDSAATLLHRAATLPQAHSLTAPKGRNTLSAPPVPTRCGGVREKMHNLHVGPAARRLPWPTTAARARTIGTTRIGASTSGTASRCWSA